jgi:hypothetical protein
MQAHSQVLSLTPSAHPKTTAPERSSDLTFDCNSERMSCATHQNGPGISVKLESFGELTGTHRVFAKDPALHPPRLIWQLKEPEIPSSEAIDRNAFPPVGVRLQSLEEDL